MRLRSAGRKRGRRGRKRQKRVLEHSANAVARDGIGAVAGRMSLQRLALPQTENWPKAVSLVCLAGLMWLMLHFFTSQRFFIYDVQVSGNQFVSSEEIYDQSGLHTLSIFYVRPSEVSQRLLGLANIKEAVVRTRLPSAVTIAVTERLPQVELESGGVRYWVDGEGVILPARGELDQAIVVVDKDETALRPGDHFDVEALHTAQQLHELLPQVSRLIYSDAKGISVPTDEGWPVVFGTPEDLPAKVAIYRSLVKKFSKEGTAVAFVDLRFLRRPYYRLRDQ